MLEAPALCPAGEGGSGVATGAMRKIRRCVQREKAAPVSRPAEGSSGITFSGRRLRRRVGREERSSHHIAAGRRRGPGVTTGAGMLWRHAGGSSSIATGERRKLRRVPSQGGSGVTTSGRRGPGVVTGEKTLLCCD